MLRLHVSNVRGMYVEALDGLCHRGSTHPARLRRTPHCGTILASNFFPISSIRLNLASGGANSLDRSARCDIVLDSDAEPDTTARSFASPLSGRYAAANTFRTAMPFAAFRRPYGVGLDPADEHAKVLERDRLAAHGAAANAANAAERAAMISADRSAAAIAAAETSRRLDREAAELAMQRRCADLASKRMADAERSAATAASCAASLTGGAGTALRSIVDSVGRRAGDTLNSSGASRSGPTSPRSTFPQPAWTGLASVAGSNRPTPMPRPFSAAPGAISSPNRFPSPRPDPLGLHPPRLPLHGGVPDIVAIRTAHELRRMLMSTVPSIRPGSYEERKAAASARSTEQRGSSIKDTVVSDRQLGEGGARMSEPPSTPLRDPYDIQLRLAGSGGDCERVHGKRLTEKTSSPGVPPDRRPPLEALYLASRGKVDREGGVTVGQGTASASVSDARDQEIKQLQDAVAEQQRTIEEYRAALQQRSDEVDPTELIARYKAAVAQHADDLARERRQHEEDTERADARLSEEKAKVTALRAEAKELRQRVIDLERAAAEATTSTVTKRTSFTVVAEEDEKGKEE